MSECSTTSTELDSSQRLKPNERQRWAKTAERLAYFTIAYNLVEGVVSIFLGIREESFALAGFGVDSLIEVASALLVLWRLKTDFEHNGSPLSLSAERKATFGIGALFILLAIIAGLAALNQLMNQNHPESTIPGVIVSTMSLSFMFYLWRSKLRVAKALSSKTLESDAACSLACIRLSVVLLAGSLLFALVPALWWVDSVATLTLAGIIFQEGRETIGASRKADFTGGCGCH